MIWLLLCILYYVRGEEAADAYKDQYCTDPRTMKKHAAYTEWADAYSCTRHRCQPGGRNLAIYTVGCKRVEAPESAIECEEVVEDTNMQFPYCCTRLRCLVVVRGEVWTRVLGQPWESLPAAPWSHMYKMKKPPPGNEFLPKSANEGPVYELTDNENEKPREKVLRASKVTPESNYNEAVPRAAQAPPSPDIVIALTTSNDQKEMGDMKQEKGERKRHSKPPSQYFEEDNVEPREGDAEGKSNEKGDTVDMIKRWTENRKAEESKQVDQSAEGREVREYYSYSYGQTQKPQGQHNRASWTEVPPAQWNEPDQETPVKAPPYQEAYHQQEQPVAPEPDKKSGKPNLQTLVDAIGDRMRDIEDVVHKMSEKVKVQKPEDQEVSAERGVQHDPENQHSKYSEEKKPKRPNMGGDHYKRFTVKNRGSKYLHGVLDASTEAPMYIEDNANGYFSDASNSVLRRSNPRIEPKVLADEPQQAPTYMAPVENRRKTHPVSPVSEEKVVKKHKKRAHKKKKRTGKVHKRHHKDGKDKRKFNRANSVENDRIVISLEDSSAVNN